MKRAKHQAAEKVIACW